VLQFVTNLNTQYAPSVVSKQQNVSFETASHVEEGSAAAVHMFTANFGSLYDPPFRYEISGSTAYCGGSFPDSPSVAEAVRRSSEAPLDFSFLSDDLKGLAAASAAPFSENPVEATLRVAPSSSGEGDKRNKRVEVWVYALSGVGARSRDTLMPE